MSIVYGAEDHDWCTVHNVAVNPGEPCPSCLAAANDYYYDMARDVDMVEYANTLLRGCI